MEGGKNGRLLERLDVMLEKARSGSFRQEEVDESLVSSVENSMAPLSGGQQTGGRKPESAKGEDPDDDIGYFSSDGDPYF